MKPFVALIILLAVVLVFLAAQSFQSQFGGTTYSPAPGSDQSTSAGGGSPRRSGAGDGSSSSTNNFRGPTGQPHIIGPSSPPPGS